MTNRQPIVGLTAALAAVLLAACSASAGPTTPPVGGGASIAPGVAATAPGDPSAGGGGAQPAASGPVIGHVGDKLTYVKLGGDQVTATVVKIFDPAIPTDASEAPLPSATHWVGVEATVDNPTDYSGEGSQFDGVTSVGANVTTNDPDQGGSYTLGDGFQGCTQTDGDPQDVERYTFCLAFPVPDGQTLAKVGVVTGGAELGGSPAPTDQATWTIP